MYGAERRCGLLCNVCEDVKEWSSDTEGGTLRHWLGDHQLHKTGRVPESYIKEAGGTYVRLAVWYARWIIHV